MFHIAEYSRIYRTHRLATATERHLFAWLRDKRREDEYHSVLQDIFRALENDPDLTEDHSWPEIEAMGKTLRG